MNRPSCCPSSEMDQRNCGGEVDQTSEQTATDGVLFSYLEVEVVELDVMLEVEDVMLEAGDVVLEAGGGGLGSPPPPPPPMGQAWLRTALIQAEETEGNCQTMVPAFQPWAWAWDTQPAKVCGSTQPLLASPGVPGFPMTNLSKGTPAVA
jgi:hypothetical protein